MKPSATEMTPSTTRLLDAIAQGVVVVDASGSDRRIVHANSAFLALSGFKLPEIAGLDAFAFLGQRTDHRSSQSLREALRGSEPASIEFLLAPKASGAMQVRLHVRLLADVPGHMLLTFEDVTRFTQTRE